MVQPSGIISIVRDQINEQTANGFYTDSELYNYLSMAEHKIADTIGYTTATSGIVSSGVREYSKPEDALNINRVEWDGYPLIKISREDIDSLEGTSYGQIGVSGSSTHYYENSLVIGLSPIPDVDKTITFFYDKTPTPLSSTSEFTIPNKYVYYTVDYVVYRAMLKDQDSRAGSYLQIWNDNLNSIKWSADQETYKNQKYIVRDSGCKYNIQRY